ncbi:DMT family transporter [Streptomyces sp. NPDC006704]|uniref:DMT family transporter n=1 Tax=Streptomyces sp. NPDC006704 TaxID=3364760 RepID=UPI0036C53E7F
MNESALLAILLSLASAAGYALAAVAQSRLAAQGGKGVGQLLTRPLWWWAVGLNAAGALMHVAALHYGPLTLVQPLGALTLVAALPLSAYYERRRVGRREWRGAAWTLAGLTGLIAVTGPASPGDALSVNEALAIATGTALLLAFLVRAGAHSAHGGGLGLATASGVASGVASALTQTVTASLARELPSGPPAWWETTLVAVLVAAFAVGGLLLSQAAYRDGLAAPLAVVNLANPAAAAVIGVALLGESFHGGPLGWLTAAASACVAARGVLMLTGATPPAPALAPTPPQPHQAPTPPVDLPPTLSLPPLPLPLPLPPLAGDVHSTEPAVHIPA